MARRENETGQDSGRPLGSVNVKVLAQLRRASIVIGPSGSGVRMLLRKKGPTVLDVAEALVDRSTYAGLQLAETRQVQSFTLGYKPSVCP